MNLTTNGTKWEYLARTSPWEGRSQAAGLILSGESEFKGVENAEVLTTKSEKRQYAEPTLLI